MLSRCQRRSFFLALVFMIVGLLDNPAVYCDAGNPGGRVLNLPVLSRSCDLRGSLVVTAEGVSAVVYNPAILIESESKEFSVSQSELLRERRLNNINEAMPLGQHSGTGVGATSLAYGSIAGYDKGSSTIGALGEYSLAEK